MKRIILSVSLIAISASLFAQKSPMEKITDSVVLAHFTESHKKDTAYVPLFEKKDTIPATIIYLGAGSNLKYESGFVIMKGFVKEGSDKYVAQPALFQYLDHKKRVFTEKVLQAF